MGGRVPDSVLDLFLVPHLAVVDVEVQVHSMHPDGSRLASGSADITVRLCDVADGVGTLILSGFSDPVYTVGFSPDGDSLAVRQDATVPTKGELGWRSNIRSRCPQAPSHPWRRSSGGVRGWYPLVQEGSADSVGSSAVIRRLVLLVLGGTAALGLCGAGGAPETWRIVRSAHFIVIGNDSGGQTRLVARELELLRAVFETVIRVRVAIGRPLIVVAAQDERTMRTLVPWYWEGRGDKRPGGVYFAREEKDWAIVRTDLGSPSQIVLHEYVHRLARTSLGALPPWLDEGLAELYSTLRVEDGVVQIGEIKSYHLRRLREGLLLPVEQLVAVDRGSAEYTEGERARLFYAESSILTHYLVLGGETADASRVVDFVKCLEEGLSDRQAVDRAFGGVEALEKELRRYIRRQTFPVVRIPATVAEGKLEDRELPAAQAAALLADFALHTGQLDAARGQVEAALRANPNLGRAHLQRGLLLFKEGRYDEATAALSQARRLAPDDALAHYRFGTLGRGSGADLSSREDALRTAIRLGPTFAPAHEALAKLVLEHEGSLEEALALATEAVRLDPGTVRNRATLLAVETRMGRVEEAKSVERELLRAVSTDPEALRALVTYYEASGLPGEADSILRRVHEQRPRNQSATRMLASFLERQGRGDEGEAILRGGLELDRRSPALLNSLAYLNATRGVKLPEALALAEDALKLAPSSASIQDTKGWVLFRLGRLGEAEQWTRKSLDAEENPDVREHLGDILEKQGRLAEARDAWQQALAHEEGDDEQRRRLEAKIAAVSNSGGVPPPPSDPQSEQSGDGPEAGGGRAGGVHSDPWSDDPDELLSSERPGWTRSPRERRRQRHVHARPRSSAAVRAGSPRSGCCWR